VTSARAALALRRAGWPRARALVGGWKAWLEANGETEHATADAASDG
jgi:3-mercaptopyruvate sulfurtransferase SseA